MEATLKRVAGTLFGILVLSYSSLSAQEYDERIQVGSPVITLDYQGDRLKRIDSAPTLSIFADGTIVMPRSYSHSRAFKGKISIAKLQELLSFIINENSFFDYSAELVKAKSSQLQRQPLPVHYSDTIISVNHNGRSKTVRSSALGKRAMAVEERQMLAVKNRLDRVMAAVKLGGIDEVINFADIANQELRKKSSKTFKRLNTNSINSGYFTVDDLERGGERSDGSISARFVSADGAAVTIDIDANGRRIISVFEGNNR